MAHSIHKKNQKEQNPSQSALGRVTPVSAGFIALFVPVICSATRVGLALKETQQIFIQWMNELSLV